MAHLSSLHSYRIEPHLTNKIEKKKVHGNLSRSSAPYYIEIDMTSYEKAANSTAHDAHINHRTDHQKPKCIVIPPEDNGKAIYLYSITYYLIHICSNNIIYKILKVYLTIRIDVDLVLVDWMMSCMSFNLEGGALSNVVWEHAII